MAGLTGFRGLIDNFVRGISGISTCRLNHVMIRRTNVVASLVRSAAIRKRDHLRGIRRLVSNVRSFIHSHRRRNSRTVKLSSFLDSITLLASRSDRSSSASGIALVAIRTTGKLRFSAMFVINVRRRLFPSVVTCSDIERVRRREHLLCMTVAHTRGHYFLSCTGDHFHCKGIRCNVPDEFLGSVSHKCVSVLSRNKRSTLFNASQSTTP